MRNRRRKYIPLLNSVEALKGRNGDKDDNSLLAVVDFNLHRDQKSACELQVFKENNGPQPVRFRFHNWHANPRDIIVSISYPFALAGAIVCMYDRIRMYVYRGGMPSRRLIFAVAGCDPSSIQLGILTSLAETNCNGLSAALRSVVFCSSS